MIPCPNIITVRGTFREIGKNNKSKIRKRNWRVLEELQGSEITWWHYHRKMAIPIGRFNIQSGVFCLWNTDNYDVRRLSHKISPFYCFRYGNKTRLASTSWGIASHFTQSNPSSHWHKNKEWLEWSKESGQEKSWSPLGNIVADTSYVEITVKDKKLIPLEGCHLYIPRQLSAKNRPPVRKPRYTLTWNELLKEIPLLHSIAIMLQDKVLLEIASKPKWYSHLGIIHRSLEDCANHMYDHLKVSHPKVTKVAIKAAVRTIPYRYHMVSYSNATLSQKDREALRKSYDVVEAELFKNHPTLVEQG